MPCTAPHRPGWTLCGGKEGQRQNLAHILEARQRKDGMSAAQAQDFLGEVVTAIASGSEVSRREVGPSVRVGVEHGSTLVWLTCRAGANAWVVTGYEKDPSGTAAGRATAVPTHSAASLTRDKMEGSGSILDDSGRDDNVCFSRTQLANIKASALEQLHTTLSHPGRVSLWDKTVGTMRHLGERSPHSSRSMKRPSKTSMTWPCWHRLCGCPRRFSLYGKPFEVEVQSVRYTLHGVCKCLHCVGFTFQISKYGNDCSHSISKYGNRTFPYSEITEDSSHPAPAPEHSRRMTKMG